MVFPKLFRRWRKESEKGAVAVEFGIIVPLFLTMVSGLFDLGLVLIGYHQVNNVLNVGLLYTIANPADQTGTLNAMNNASSVSSMSSTVTTSCSCLEGTPSNCTTACNDGSTPATYVQLKVTKNVTIVGLFLTSNPYPISRTLYVRVS